MESAYPDYTALFLETPLYNHFTVESDPGGCYYLYHLVTFNKRIDAFCPGCGKFSTFQGADNFATPISNSSTKYDLMSLQQLGYRDGIAFFMNRIWHTNFYCSRINEHKMCFSFYMSDGQVTKVGQYPSQAELTLPELRKYQPILSKEKYKELNRGIGLTAHGVGIGAFVYLRRVFEDLIEEAHKKESTESSWNEEVYLKSRMEEKIQLLQHSLPTFLVDNNAMYSILSKGIHELSEKDCLDFFPAMKLSVELILDEKLERYQKQKKIEEAKASITKIQAQLAKE